MKYKSLQIFAKRVVEEAIKNSSKKLLTMKEISIICSEIEPMYKPLFGPRSIGHMVRLLGFQPFRKRNGWTIYK